MYYPVHYSQCRAMFDMAAIPTPVQEMIIDLLQGPLDGAVHYCAAVLGSGPFASMVFLKFTLHHDVDPLIKPTLCLGWGNSCVFPKTSSAYTEAAHTRLEATTSTLWRGWTDDIRPSDLSTVQFIPPTNPSYLAAGITMRKKAHAIDKAPMECKTAADLRQCQQAALCDVQDKPTYGPLWLVPLGHVFFQDAPRFDTEHYEERPHFKGRMTNFDYEGGWELARCITLLTILITENVYDRNTNFTRRVLTGRIASGIWSKKMNVHHALNDASALYSALSNVNLNVCIDTK